MQANTQKIRDKAEENARIFAARALETNCAKESLKYAKASKIFAKTLIMLENHELNINGSV